MKLSHPKTVIQGVRKSFQQIEQNFIEVLK